ncbi:MAG: dihydroorotase family protein [Bacteroidota bacterium]|nr:dihydroorotase family protein [Candidatus Kapabacteria bacterium]MDW8219228.1 dihydroorotase family protein [Bacteroidota bacterium]
MAYLYDLIIRNVRLVRPHHTRVETVDIAVKDGKIAAYGLHLDSEQAHELYDGKNMLAFPGLVDAHMHTGIYSPLAEDAMTESQAAAMGGVTSSLNYIRTGRYYLNKSAPYREFFPEVLAISQGRFYVDYGYHLAPMMRQHIDEMPMLARDMGVPSFKIFMFYGSYGLHGRSTSQREFLMIPDDETYDIAHFEFVMRGAKKAMNDNPSLRDVISVSLHCETAEIMNAYTKLVESEGKLSGLPAYSASRPPHSEGLAIFIASYLAHETELPNINLLHLTSRKAVDAAMMMQAVFPHINFRREVTIGHLLLDTDLQCPHLHDHDHAYLQSKAKRELEWTQLFAKVNPPIRPREDVEYLWQAVLDGRIDWICSDHACCSAEFKTSAEDPKNVFVAKSGFGGTEYLLSGVFSEGTRRGLALNRIAELCSWNPAQRYGLFRKGDLGIGYDADIVLFDPTETFTVRARESLSAQGYTPFEGMTLKGRVKTTFLRGKKVFENGAIVGTPQGQYLHRPYQ